MCIEQKLSTSEWNTGIESTPEVLQNIESGRDEKSNPVRKRKRRNITFQGLRPSIKVKSIQLIFAASYIIPVSII